MLTERDRSVVYSMCRAGMSLDTLKLSFPQFDAADVEGVYRDYKGEDAGESGGITISCNCS